MPAKTSKMNGAFWGARARDWADLMEGTGRPAFEAARQRSGVGAGTRYLDVGCGAGLAVQMAAGRGALVSGIDASDAMLAIARARTPDGSFQIADVEQLPFPDDSFDVTTAFNSVQYAGDPGAALAEVTRVTRPGGAVVIMTWGDPQGMEAAELIGVLKPLLPPPPPGAPGPFALSDEAALRAFATQAGLTPTEVFDVDCPWDFPDQDTALRAVTSPGVAVRAAEMVGDDAVQQAYATGLQRFRQKDGSYRVAATFRCLLATA